jgi:hypothetical protein
MILIQKLNANAKDILVLVFIGMGLLCLDSIDMYCIQKLLKILISLTRKSKQFGIDEKQNYLMFGGICFIY